MQQRGNHQDDVTGLFVHFQFTDFIPSDYQGHENAQAEPRRGYIVFNNHRKDFGFGTFGSSDSYTIHYDVLNQIRVMHADLMKDIVQSGGFLINGTWFPVDAQGGLVTE